MLAEVAAVAETEEVDVVLVAGDLFDTAAPSAESEQIVYEALLVLARTDAHVAVVSGNHDNERRLQAVAPLLELGTGDRRRAVPAARGRRRDRRPLAGRRRAARAALLPFLSQRWVVRADELDGDRRGRARPGLRRAHAPPHPGAGLRVPVRHGERPRRPPLRASAPCSAGASGRPTRSTSTPSRPRPSRPTISTGPSATSTAASGSPGRARSTTPARRSSSTSARPWTASPCWWPRPTRAGRSSSESTC